MAGPLLTTLRARTADVHAQLEQELDLLRPPISLLRLRLFIERMWGFYAPWEALAGKALPSYETLSKLEPLRADLARLGATPWEIARLPHCHAAAGLVATPQAALGALYVVEGSALGGVVIGRALGEAGLPALSFFDTDGAQTALAWRRIQSALAAAPVEDHSAVADGAVAAFGLLSAWLAPARPQA